jgi:hypothetical protein
MIIKQRPDPRPYNQISLAAFNNQIAFEFVDWIETDDLINDLRTKSQ